MMAETTLKQRILREMVLHPLEIWCNDRGRWLVFEKGKGCIFYDEECAKLTHMPCKFTDDARFRVFYKEIKKRRGGKR